MSVPPIISFLLYFILLITGGKELALDE